MSLTRQLAERVNALSIDELSDRDYAMVRLLLLDHLAVVLRGSQTDAAAAFRRYLGWGLANAGGRARLPIFGTGDDAEAVQAAMANAVAGHSIELDDTHNASSCHPGVVVFPAALAMAALTGADERAFVRAVALGYEVMCRVGRAVNPTGHYQRQLHPTATCGHFGAAATAGVLLGLDVDGITSALGIASTMAAGTLEFLADGTWTKRLHPALAVRNGIDAAILAANGFEGPRDGLGGRRGFLTETYSTAPHPQTLLAEWAVRPLEVHGTSIKPHSCCRYNQGPIDAVLAVRSAHDLRPEAVTRIEIGLLSAAVDIVWEPVSLKRHPRNLVDAQFSLPFAVAVALVDGQAGLAQFQSNRLEDSTILETMDRVVGITDRDLDRRYPEQWGAWARLHTRDGRVFEAQIPDPKGDPRNPLTPAEMRQKLNDLAGPVISARRVQAIADAVDRLPEPGSLAALLDALAERAGTLEPALALQR